jgi:hypothetical protein
VNEDFTADNCGAPDEIRPYNFEPLIRKYVALNESVAEDSEGDEEDDYNEDNEEDNYHVDNVGAQGNRRTDNLAW